ncbi:uncharacterized protein [Montipora foliosa]|uniref:uncharacterized protein n=1 Tax=Montipora foliosa TaxID=591990 RepID=UPI0035F134B4
MDEEASSVVLLPEVKVEPFENSENHADSEESSLGSPTDESSLPRFGETSEEDIQRLLEHRSCSENTWRATKNAVKILRDYMEEKSMDVNFENLDKQALNDLLRKFYVEARKKNGDYYKSSALGSIRFGIHRYLQSQQRNIDIRNDPEFTESNKVFKAQVIKLNKQGKGEVNRSDIGPDDLKKLYLSDVLSPFSADGLQRKVFFDLLMYLPGKRNRSNVREQTRDTYLIGYDSSTGLKYIYPNPSHCENVFAEGKCPKMKEKPGNPRCPVSSFLKYLSKLNPMNLYLWQRPKASFKHHACEDDPVWYENAAVGHNSLGEMMTNMSKLARLSRIYTNNCIRGTYMAILDSLVDDYPLITTLVSLPASQKYQPILPRDTCDERPTMVSVNGKYRVSSPDETSVSRNGDTQHGSSAFSAVSSRDQGHLEKGIVCSSHSALTSSNKSPTSNSTNLSFSEKQTELKPVSPTEMPFLGMRYYSNQKELQSSLAAYRLSQLQTCSSHYLHSPLINSSLKNNDGSFALPHPSSSSVRVVDNYPGHMGSKVVYCQTAPTMASSSSRTMRSSSDKGLMTGSPVTTHVLDTARGIPARNVQIQLYFEELRPDTRMWKHIATGVTNADGRISNLLSQEQFMAGKYMMRFETEAYFKETGVSSFFYPYVEIVFLVSDPSQHHHVPLLLSPFSYSTYRGS